MNPPRWSETLLRTMLIDRDRETISGDLLEEYREVALPARGLPGARWWYRRQVAGFIWRATWLPVAIGLAMGTILGVMVLVDTARQPLADDDASVMLMWVAGILTSWTIAAVAVTWRGRRVGDTIIAGAILGVATMLVFHAAAITRLNLFLDVIQHRDDWRNLVGRYHGSGFVSLRTYANYEYLRQTPLLLGIGVLAGTVSGVIGAAVNGVVRAVKAR